MKQQISCKIIEDLLPVYVDECCSDETKELIDSHLEECIKCKKKVVLLKADLTCSETEDINPDKRVIRKSINRIKLIRRLGLISLALCLIVIFVVSPILNYVNGRGLTYANVDEFYKANNFVKSIKKGDYEEAYTYLNINDNYERLISEKNDEVEDGINQIKDNGFEWYNEVCKNKFMANMTELEHSGYIIESFSFEEIYKGNDSWYVNFYITSENSEVFEMFLIITENGISQISTPVETENNFEDYLNIYYIMPTKNEIVFEILYQNSDFDWQKLFEY